MGNMRFKVGDRVRIKSLDWYNENKDKYGEVDCKGCSFVNSMTLYCNSILTIEDKTEYCYLVKENAFSWTDEMIECLVERNRKTYPYKIGDRVILKGNNRCATITDLKYNSWGNLSYYITIDNDKGISVDYPTNLLLPYDNMIDGLVEEEVKPKFKIGDKITNGKCYLTILNLTSDRYIVEDYLGDCGTLYFNTIEDWKLVEDGTIVDYVKESNDRYRIVIDPRFDIEVDEGEYYAVRRKNEYPKTYEECCKIIYSDPKFYVDTHLYSDTLGALYKLLICRDAYWKIAGDETGLGKPWKPDWTSFESCKYIIEFHENKIRIANTHNVYSVFAFPTEEMRNAFYENFKELIAECKELL